MNKVHGQAARICLEAAHQIGRIALLLFMLALGALGLFAFSLSRHPLELPHLASWIATTASGDGIKVRMNKAELAWAGYHQGGDVPLVLRLSDVAVRNAVGITLVTIPQADLVVPPADLFGARRPILLRASAAQLSGSTAAVTIGADIWPGSGYTLARGAFYVSIGPGLLGAAGAAVPISSASFTLQISPGAADIVNGVAALAPIGGSAPHAAFSFTARRGTGWNGTLHASIDAVRAQELGQYWPRPALHITRNWVVTHITTGVASKAGFTFTLSAPGDLSRLKLTGATGSFNGTGLTLYWLQGGVPPITGLDGVFTMPDEDEAVITSSAGQVGHVALAQGRMNITGVSKKDQTGVLSLKVDGTAQDVLAVLNAPPLALLHTAPPVVMQTTGQVAGNVTAVIPFKKDLVPSDIKLDIAAALDNFTMPTMLPQLGLTKGEAQIRSDGHSLSVKAKVLFAGEPASLALTGKFTGKDASKYTEDFTMSGLAGPLLWHMLGLDSATALNGPATGTAPFSLHVWGAASGAQTAQIQADITPVALSLPVAGWRKEAGQPGSLAALMQFENGTFQAVQRFDAHAPGLNIAGVQRGDALVFSTADIGRTQASGTLNWPAAKGGRWQAVFSGPVLDLRQPKMTSGNSTAPAVPSGPVWAATLNFAQLYLAGAPAPPLSHFTLAAQGQGATLLQAQAAAQGLNLAITPHTPNVLPSSRVLALHDDDAGSLLRALDEYPHLQGGVLDVNGIYGAGIPTSGTVSLLNARFANAPEVTKFLQALTLYGLADAASGPGLKISRAEIPFTLQDDVLQLRQARAWSSSLGFTASGSFNLAANSCDLDTTIVPLYALNALPGKIPLIGRLFSPEKGGGLLAMRAHISGPIGDVKVSINPLSALTPGFLRSIFGIGK